MIDDADTLLEVGSLSSLAGGDPRSNSEYTGTKALFVAVLEEGIRNYCGPPGYLRTEAETWVRSNRRSVFSFTVICETLGLEPDAVRRALSGLQGRPMQSRRIRAGVRQTPVLTRKSKKGCAEY